jgi:hypothetical protein
MTPEVTKTVLNKIILNVWIESVLQSPSWSFLLNTPIHAQFCVKLGN